MALEVTCNELRAEVASRKPVMESRSRSTQTPAEWELPRVQTKVTNSAEIDKKHIDKGKIGKVQDAHNHPPPKT